MLLVTVAILEAISHFGLGALMEGRADYVIPSGELVISELTDRQIDWYFRDGFDPDLGWTVRPDLERTFSNFSGVEWTWSTDARGGRAVPVLLFLSRHRIPPYRPYLEGFQSRLSDGVPVTVLDMTSAAIPQSLLRDPSRRHFSPEVHARLGRYLAAALDAGGPGP